MLNFIFGIGTGDEMDRLKEIIKTDYKAFVYLITCLTGNMFHQQFTMAIFSLFAGLIVVQNRIENQRSLTC
ncbi:MAG: hypothetical protein U9P72_08705 [Campylobacterota bacterium]|nr:hypothetical protein [Campylobacterota bacterium]